MEHGAHAVALTLVAAVAAGVFLMILADRLRVPAIVPLLVGGVCLGPQGLGLIDPAQLGGGLAPLISIAVAVILFEGGMTLDPKGLRQAPGVIRKLLTLGVLVTWVLVTAAVFFMFRMLNPQFPFSLALLAGALVVVTGPTVVTPILRRISVRDRLRHILHYEGVFIDAVGVFVILLSFEFLVASAELQMLGQMPDTWSLPGIWERIVATIAGPFQHLVVRVLIGASTGVAFGYAMAWVLHQRWIAAHMTNLAVLAGGLTAYLVAEEVIGEAGILAVTVCGFLLALLDPPGLKEAKEFKNQLTDLSIAVLFVLLAAKLDLSRFAALGWPGALVVLWLVVVVRPVNIFLCTLGEGLGKRERLFLSWVAPRGIVAASMASLFALRLQPYNVRGLELLEPFVYAVILVTVVVQGLSAGFVARVLGLTAPERSDWLIVGAHRLARDTAQFIRQTLKVEVTVMDLNSSAIQQAELEGIPAVSANALAHEVITDSRWAQVGQVLAITDNSTLNVLINDRYGQAWGGSMRQYRWEASGSEVSAPDLGHHRGSRIWRNIGRPLGLSQQIADGDAHTGVMPASEWLAHDRDVSPLMICVDGNWRLFEGGEILEDGTETEVFVVARDHYCLVDTIRTYGVLRYGGSDYGEMLRLAVEQVGERHADLPVAELTLTQGLSDPAMADSTMLVEGVCAPHTYCSVLRVSVCVLVQVTGEAGVLSPEGRPIRLAFVLISPAGDNQGHLDLLAEIARLLSLDGLIDSLHEASSDATVLHVLDRAARHA
jgi:NhaP-type Na+/H+ or K+/H+ antiporter/mannitol/fructose-specific phosphotransferase system IIA component (Ntr-type)